MKTLLNIHFSSCASTSLFRLLGNHPQIVPSKIKEPVEDIGWENYYDQWDNDFKDNIYLDGTPKLFLKYDFEKQNLLFDRFCVICVLRNHIDYISSRMTVEQTQRQLNAVKYDLFHDHLDNLVKAVGRENMFIVNMKDIEENQKDIYEFLNISKDYFFKLPWLHRSFGDDLSPQHPKFKTKYYFYYRRIAKFRGILMKRAKVT